MGAPNKDVSGWKKTSTNVIDEENIDIVDSYLYLGQTILAHLQKRRVRTYHNELKYRNSRGP